MSGGGLPGDNWFAGWGGPAPDGPLGFAGQFGVLRDPDTGLYYCRERWYDPATKQFLSPDPLSVGGTGEANLYTYAGNDPLNAADADGLDRTATRGNMAMWIVESPAVSNGSYNWSGRGIARAAIPVGHRGTEGERGNPFGPGRSTADHTVTLGQRFGGGIIKKRTLGRAAASVFQQNRDLSDLTRVEQEEEIAKLIGDTRCLTSAAASEKWRLSRFMELAKAADQEARAAEAAQAERDWWVELGFDIAEWAPTTWGAKLISFPFLGADAGLNYLGNWLPWWASYLRAEGFGAIGDFFYDLNAGAIGRGAYYNYQGYRAHGLGGWDSALLSSPIVGDTGRLVAELSTWKSYAGVDLGRDLSGVEYSQRVFLGISAAASAAAGGLGLAGRIAPGSSLARLGARPVFPKTIAAFQRGAQVSAFVGITEAGIWRYGWQTNGIRSIPGFAPTLNSLARLPGLPGHAYNAVYLSIYGKGGLLRNVKALQINRGRQWVTRWRGTPYVDEGNLILRA